MLLARRRRTILETQSKRVSSRVEVKEEQRKRQVLPLWKEQPLEKEVP